MLKFQKLDKRMNWHDTYNFRLDFSPLAFRDNKKSSQEIHFMLFDLFIKASKEMNEALGYAPPADLTFRYKEIYGLSPAWAFRDARSNQFSGNN